MTTGYKPTKEEIAARDAVLRGYRVLSSNRRLPEDWQEKILRLIDVNADGALLKLFRLKRGRLSANWGLCTLSQRENEYDDTVHSDALTYCWHQVAVSNGAWDGDLSAIHDGDTLFYIESPTASPRDTRHYKVTVSYMTDRISELLRLYGLNIVTDENNSNINVYFPFGTVFRYDRWLDGSERLAWLVRGDHGAILQVSKLPREKQDFFKWIMYPRESELGTMRLARLFPNYHL